ncbi:MAG: CPBP family intramembrane metalloprotease [Candidatus Omnitrophota bacterium]|jgi:membrane protease YdiL (CAAX protease family)|nr:MAG: CPBP family intramembrane metalloprotease [Candidatus Omnitrophota bacterium]
MIESILRGYYFKSRQYSDLRFIVELLILSFALKFALGLSFAFLNTGPVDNAALAQTAMNPLLFFVLACLLSPPLETICCQWLPIAAVSSYTEKLFPPLLLSSIFFASLHFIGGIFQVLITFFPGLLFAWSFLVKREQSLWQALWITSLIHTIHNIASMILLYSGRFLLNV